MEPCKSKYKEKFQFYAERVVDKLKNCELTDKVWTSCLDTLEEASDLFEYFLDWFKPCNASAENIINDDDEIID